MAGRVIETMPELFDHAVGSAPDAAWVITDEGTSTFGDAARHVDRLASGLAAAGAAVACNDLGAGRAEERAAAIEAAGGTAMAVPFDVTDEKEARSGVDAVLDRFGRIDVLVNNAIYQGLGTMVEFADLVEEDLHRIFEGNVYAQLALIRAVLPQMKERNSGTIVNMISATAYQDPPARIGNGGWGMGYAMSKAALARVAPLLHRELEDFDIRLFSVDPGFVVTEKTEALGRAGQFAQHYKPATPPVIGAAIRWLVEDRESDSLRGQIVMAQRECKRRSLLPGWP
jgi:NAD(P)-dependent dehydrogenase (short-subunit alcohol dehydrogenase family)